MTSTKAKILKVSPEDTVGVALGAIRPGKMAASSGETLEVSESVPKGHKVALRELQVGEPVIKFGYPIGIVTAPIEPGEHVHTQNMSTVSGRRSRPDRVPMTISGADAKGEPVVEVAPQTGAMTPKRTAIRSRFAIVPSVSCANIVCEQLGREDPELAILPHQHGCGHIGEDLELVQTTLAALASHPNVAKAIVVALGCEANDASNMARIARDRGGQVATIGIQAEGGVEAAADRAREVIRQARAEVPDSFTYRSADIRVGVMADRSATVKSPNLVQKVLDRVKAEGFRTATVSDLVLSPRFSKGTRLSVPDRWRTTSRPDSQALELLNSSSDDDHIVVAVGSDDVERLTALTALGAHAVILITGRGSLIGSTLAPTLKVAASGELDSLTDIIDVPAGPPDLVGRVIESIYETVGGEKTKAELLGMRDLDLWRISPFY